MQLAPDLPAGNYCVSRRVSITVDMGCISLLFEECKEETVPRCLAELNLCD